MGSDTNGRWGVICTGAFPTCIRCYLHTACFVGSACARQCEKSNLKIQSPSPSLPPVTLLWRFSKIWDPIFLWEHLKIRLLLRLSFCLHFLKSNLRFKAQLNANVHTYTVGPPTHHFESLDLKVLVLEPTFIWDLWNITTIGWPKPNLSHF